MAEELTDRYLPRHVMHDEFKIAEEQLRREIINKVNAIIEEEERIIRESKDPDELMKWLDDHSQNTRIKEHFMVYYHQFIDRWNAVFGDTSNIPQAFKDRINVRVRTMR